MVLLSVDAAASAATAALLLQLLISLSFCRCTTTAGYCPMKQVSKSRRGAIALSKVYFYSSFHTANCCSSLQQLNSTVSITAEQY
eukprot:15292-Heterococcus_DN1.PRE.2